MNVPSNVFDRVMKRSLASESLNDRAERWMSLVRPHGSNWSFAIVCSSSGEAAPARACQPPSTSACSGSETSSRGTTSCIMSRLSPGPKYGWMRESRFWSSRGGWETIIRSIMPLTKASHDIAVH